MNQFWKIELEFMPVTRGIGTLDFTEFALKAVIHNGVCFLGVYAQNITIILVVNQCKEVWKGIAILEAHPTSVTDLEGPNDLGGQCVWIPIDGLRRIVAEPVRW